MGMRLSVRYWPQCPPPDVKLSDYDEKALVYGQTTLDLKMEQTAFMMVDCWNLTSDGPPLVPGMPKYWDYSFIAGGVSWLRRAEEIVKTRILPCLVRARAARMTVLHAPTSYIANRHPQCQALAKAVEEPRPAPAPQWPPREFVAERWQRFTDLRYGKDCARYWNRIRATMDIAEAVRPLEDEIVFSTLAQLEHVLSQRRILNVILVGFAANACLVAKPGALRDIAARGYEVVVLRDCTTAIEAPWSVDSLSATRATMDYIEMAFGYTATSEAFLAAIAGQRA